MSSQIERLFSFISSAAPEDTFQVVNFIGTEGISQLYRFEIMLVSKNHELDLEQVLEAGATFRFECDNDGLSFFFGVLSKFEQLHSYGAYAFFRAVLVPKLWWSTQSIQNQVFLQQTTPRILETVLKQSGLTSLDYEFRLAGDYSKEWEFICQYRESNYQFISRWMEWEGMYFFFESHDSGEKLIITDTGIAEAESRSAFSLAMAEDVGQASAPVENLMVAWSCIQQRSPQSVRVKDYNYLKPDLDVSGEADVHPGGVGDVYLYGEHIQSPEEASRLARVRAEELSCRQKQFHGRSMSPLFRSGNIISLTGHYRPDFNSRYQVVIIKHEGHQVGYLVSGLKEHLSKLEHRPSYINSLQAMPESVQYRPNRRTEKPRIYGSLNAHIDSSGSGQYAELDEQGRYKVILPFDLSGRRDGKASTWLRMSQPYAGADHGMHFPLHKGSEVLLTFIDGDPDRPVIAGAVPNPAHPSPVHSANATRAGFRTAGGGSLHFENLEGKERIVMRSGDGRSHMSLGKGSPAEHITSSDHTVQYSSVGASTLSGLFHTLLTYSSYTQVTGFKKAQLMAALIEELISAIPDIAVASAVANEERDGESPDDATDSDAVKWTQGICEMAGPFLMLVSEAGYLDIIGRAVDKYFENTNKLKKDLADKPAFFAGHVEQGTITQLNNSGKNIIFGTSEGDVYSYASDNVISSAKKVELNASEEIEAVTKGGRLNLHCEPLIAHPDKGTSLIIENDNAKFTCKRRGLFASKTEIKYEHALNGPKNTLTTEGHGGKATLATAVNSYGPALNYKIEQQNGKSGEFDIVSSNLGVKTTVKSGKSFGLSSETVTLTALSGETEKAKVELKNNGEVMIKGGSKVTLSAGSGGLKAIIVNGSTTKIGDLVVKQ